MGRLGVHRGRPRFCTIVFPNQGDHGAARGLAFRTRVVADDGRRVASKRARSFRADSGDVEPRGQRRAQLSYRERTHPVQTRCRRQTPDASFFATAGRRLLVSLPLRPEWHSVHPPGVPPEIEPCSVPGSAGCAWGVEEGSRAPSPARVYGSASSRRWRCFTQRANRRAWLRTRNRSGCGRRASSWRRENSSRCASPRNAPAL